MVRLSPLASILGVVALFGTAAASAQDPDPPEPTTRVAGFVSIGPSFASIHQEDRVGSGDNVGSQFGMVSLSLELRVLVNQRFGFAFTPLTWQPSGGVQRATDHWRFVRVGAGPRLQLLSRGERSQLTLGYDLSYLRATDVEYDFIDWGEGGERSRTFQSLGHSVSLRFDTPIGRSAARIGGRLEGGLSDDATMAWFTVGVSVGFGQS